MKPMGAKLGGFRLFMPGDTEAVSKRYFECVVWIEYPSELSLGINVSFTGPNLSIFLPIVSFRIGWTQVRGLVRKDRKV